MNFSKFCIFIALFTPITISAAPLKEIPNPDFTKGEPIPDGATQTWNLGPTGLTGWMHSHKEETSSARQVFITSVHPQSPSKGKIEENDVILGVNDKLFSVDPRREVGEAVTMAEAKNGEIKFRIWRKNKTEEVTISIPAIGEYSKTAPFDCQKSKIILKQGIEQLEKIMTSGKRLNPIESSYNCLALLANGEKKHYSIVKKHISRLSKYKDPERKALHSWYYGPITMLIAEYTMLTGDKSFLKDLTRMCNEIIEGQSVVGSWGHKFIHPEEKILSGYGMMNAPGIPLTIGLVLSKKAGIKAPGLDQAIKKNSQLVRFYVGKGSIPYGDHPPGKDLHDDNGKNGSAAVLFDLLGDKKAAEYFTRTSVACHGGARDQGHTGNYFNLLWAMPGVSRSGPHATGAWLKEFGWHNDLARSFNGELVFLGQAIPKRTVFHGWQSTGFYMLGYAMPLKKLYLTGKKDSAAPQISIQEASQLISDGKGWSRKNGAYGYHKRSTAELMKGLESWSPIVRNHSASTLKARKDVSIQKLIKLLKSDSVYTQLGACEAIKRKRNEASAAVPQLQKLLFSEDLWVRIKAAEALAAIGSKAFDTLPTLLKMMANPATEKDPRNMQQRYLTIALFSPGSGMVRKAIKEVDKKLMYEAIRAGLKNEDGWARREISTVYDHLTFNEIKPILPQIFEAIKTPAPSGIMFADKSRLDGLKLLAKHNIKEGLPWAVKLLKSERWGFGNRAKAALNVIKTYGANAQPHVPELEKFVIHLNKVKGWDDTKIDTLKIREVIDSVKKSNKKPKLISLEGIK